MATVTHGGVLPDSSQKTDFYALIDNSTVSGIVNADISNSALIAASKLSGVATSGINSNITQLTGLSTPLTTAQGGTGSTANANAAGGVVVPTGATNAANGAVILNGSGQLPAVDGSLLTNITSGLSKVSTATPSAVSSFSITSLSPGINYMLIAVLNQSASSSNQYLTFNSDSGANYAYQYGSFNNASATAGHSNGQANIQLYSGIISCPTYYIVYFKTIPGNNNAVIVTAFSNVYISSYPQELYTSAYYSGASALTSVQVATSSGTFTGNATLYAFN